MFSSELKGLIEEVRSMQSRRGLAVGKLRSASASLGVFDALEPGIKLKASPLVPEGRICAVDGGIVAQEFHGVDLFLVRACGVSFQYSGGAVKAYDYQPGPLPEYRVFAKHSLQSHEFNWFNGLYRLKAEIECAIASAEKFQPTVLFLDGSIMPQLGDRPARDSTAFELYEEVIDAFKRLYALSAQKEFLLAGIIKDSRGRHFLDLLCAGYRELDEYSTMLSRTSDTVFLHDFLDEGERTPAFKYASAASEHLVLRDIGEWGRKVASMYLKPTALDRPLRVDFLLDGSVEQIARSADLIYSLSRSNKTYAYPAVLIEADMQAYMNPNEARFVSDALFSSAGKGPDLMALRRNSRPFR